MRDRSNQNRFSAYKIGDIVRKYWTIDPAIASRPFPPKRWIGNNASNNMRDFVAVADAQANFLRFIVRRSVEEFSSRLRKELELHCFSR